MCGSNKFETRAGWLPRNILWVPDHSGCDFFVPFNWRLCARIQWRTFAMSFLHRKLLLIRTSSWQGHPKKQAQIIFCHQTCTFVDWSPKTSSGNQTSQLCDRQHYKSRKNRQPFEDEEWGRQLGKKCRRHHQNKPAKCLITKIGFCKYQFQDEAIVFDQK